MAIFNVKQGTLRTLPSTIVPGTMWVVNDAGELHIDLEDEIMGESYRVRIGDFQIFDTLEDLRLNRNKSPHALYYIKPYKNQYGVELGNVMARYDADTDNYFQINMDTGATSIEIENDTSTTLSPNLLTDVNYNPNTRKLTLTLGDRAALQVDFDALKVVVDRLDDGVNTPGSVKYQVEQERVRAVGEEDRIEGLANTAQETVDNLISGDFAKATEDIQVLLGNDKSETNRATKSVRTIANEELTEKLIPENAKESLDTLKEIADWIQTHPDEASAMNTAINNLKAYVGTIPSQAYSGDVVNYISEHADKVTATYSGSAAIAGKTLNGIVTIKGGVKETNGVITNDSTLSDVVLAKVATSAKAEDISLNSGTSVETKLGNVDTSIGNLNDAVGSIGTSISNINRDIEDLQNGVSGLPSEFAGTADIASVSEGVVTLKGGIKEESGVVSNDTTKTDITLKKLATTGMAVDVEMQNGKNLEEFLSEFKPQIEPESTWDIF